jgi:two-component system, OmpR family, phosphate regulon sensor histidine kinase PhoR
MTKPIKKIGLFLIIIALLPLMFFTFRELSSISENEKVIGEIYKSQLESILFSVNQYSDDVVRRWATKIQIAEEVGGINKNVIFERLKALFDDNGAVQSIFIADSSLTKKIILSKSSNIDSTCITASLYQNKKILSRLYQLKKNNFLKIEPLNGIRNETVQYFLFILDDDKICCITVNRVKLVLQNLSSKILNAAGNEFIIAVFDSASNQNIYSTKAIEIKDISQRKNLWLIPKYSLGIASRGITIESLVKERTYTSIYFIIGLAVLMLITAWFGYKNIKHQVDLAQIKSEFVSNVSHELRTPLALINMFIETLSMGRIKSEEKRDEYYKIIHQETERLSKIVNRILNFSKIEAEKWKYNFQSADLNYLAEHVYGNYKYHLEQNGFEFIFEPCDGELNAVIDVEAISESLINLIDNAVKYSMEKKYIAVKTGKQNNCVYLEVVDKGTGISADEQIKIFDKFYRSKSDNVHNAKGTGLGLTLVKLIIEAHKGEIKLTSEIGKGSSFRLLFPEENIY